MALFELDSPFRALARSVSWPNATARPRLPAPRTLPGIRRLLANRIAHALAGTALAAGVATGTMAVPAGLHDLRPPASASAPAPVLLAAALSEAPEAQAFITFGAPPSAVPAPDLAFLQAIALPVVYGEGVRTVATGPMGAITVAHAALPEANPIQPAVAVPASVAAQPAAQPREAEAAAAPPVEAPTPVPPPAPAAPAFYWPAVVGGDWSLEARLLDGINAERAAAGLGGYALDSGLSELARVRSQQMVDQGYFGHQDPQGRWMYTELLAHAGIGYAWAGENLAMNNYSAEESPARAIIALMASPTHRANMLAGDFSRVGIGAVHAGDGRIIYTMIFIG